MGLANSCATNETTSPAEHARAPSVTEDQAYKEDLNKNLNTDDINSGFKDDNDIYFELSRRTLWKQWQVRQLHAKFKKLSGGSPTMSRDVFVKTFLVDTHFGRNDELSDSVFAMFDRDGSGCVDFVEFVLALSSACQGKNVDRLKFIFEAYDSDKDSFISREELVLFLEAVVGSNDFDAAQPLKSTPDDDIEESPSHSQPELEVKNDERKDGDEQKEEDESSSDNKDQLAADSTSPSSSPRMPVAPHLRRSASDLLPTFEESQRQHDRVEKARELLAFADKSGGTVPLKVFLDWACQHVEVSDLLSRFDILPTIHEEREKIKELLSGSFLHVDDVWCVLDYKWWNMWKDYVGYDLNGRTPRHESDDSTENLPEDGKQDEDSNGDTADGNMKSYQRPISIDNMNLQESPRILRNDIAEEVDYVVIPKDAWDLLQEWYGGGPAFERTVIAIGGSKLQKIELYPLFLTLHIVVEHKPVKAFKGDHNNSKALCVSAAVSLKDLLSEACALLKVGTDQSRLWIGDGSASSWNRIGDESDGAEGEEVSDNDTLADLQFSSETAVLVETQLGEKWPMDEYQQKLDEWKEFQIGQKIDVRDHLKQWYTAIVKEIKTPKDISKSKQVKIHYEGWSDKWDEWVKMDNVCECPPRQCSCEKKMAAHQSQSQSRTTSKKRYSYAGWGRAHNVEAVDATPGCAGLFNLGNTCFMNSTLQCLSHSQNLTSYFLTSIHKNDLNIDNPLGTGGKLAEEYCTLIKQLWSGKYSAVAPNTFKKALGHFAPQFSGFQQHDTQELLAYLLDGLHEDLNRVVKKPLTEKIEAGSRSDEVVAKLAWNTHLLRNRSIIVDLFQAQLKSTVICPNENCKNVSITFDPFMYLSVPLPMVTTEIIPLTFFPLDGKPVRFNVTLPKVAGIGDMKVTLSKMAENVSPEVLVVADVYKNKIFRTLSDSIRISSIGHSDETSVYEQDLSLRVEGNKKGKDHICYSQIIHETSRDPKYGSRRFGEPLLITYTKRALNSDIHKHVHRRLKIWLPKPKKSSKKADPESSDTETPETESPPDPEEAKTESKPPYVISIRDHKSIQSCGRCKFNLRCNGCILPNDDKTCDLTSKALLAIVWDEEIVPSVRQNMMEKMIHPSAQKQKRSDNDRRRKEMENSLTLDSCLKLFTKQEVLGKEDAWYCSKCKDFQQATKKFDIWSCPEVLIIHIKRFLVNRGRREKISTYVDFPINGLDLSPFVISKDEEAPIYDLYAIANHSGGLGGGHYTAFAKNRETQSWYSFNDNTCSAVEPRNIKSSLAYVLFYKRRH